MRKSSRKESGALQVLASVFRRGGKSKILDPAVLAEAEIHNQHNLALALPDEILIAIFFFFGHQ